MTPPVRLILLRHGEAERLASCDELRSLTPRGRQDARDVSEAIRGLEQLPSAIYSSSFLRAWETAEIISAGLRIDPVRTLADITPDDDPRRAFLRLDALFSVPGAFPLVVTHMPLIGTLTGLLVDGDPGAGAGVATASGVFLVGDVFAPGQMRIARRLSP